MENDSAYHRMFQRLPIGLFRARPDGEILDANPALIQILGYVDRDSLLARNAADLFVSAEAYQLWKRELESSGEIQHKTLQLLRYDGSTIWALNNTRLIVTKNGDGACYEGCLQDHTASMLAEEQLRKEYAMTKALVQASEALTTTLDFELVLEKILEEINRVVPHDAANIMLLQDNELHVARCRGYGPVHTEYLSQQVYQSTDFNIFKHMVDTGEPIFIPDTSKDPNWIIPAHAEWIRSYACAPIILHDEIKGFFNLDSITAGYFTEEYAKPLQAFAKHAAIAIENARLFSVATQKIIERKRAEKALQEAHEELEQKVQERTQELEYSNEALKSEIQRRQVVEEKLQLLARTDPLTGLLNRRRFLELCEQELKRCTRYQHELSMLIFDLDNFKNINDTHGHSVGDHVLQAVATLSKTCLRDSDLIGRYGGEEFAVLLPVTDIQLARNVAERLRADIEATNISTESGIVSITISIGVSGLVGLRDQSVDEMLQHADQALYISKNNGRNQVTVWKEEK